MELTIEVVGFIIWFLTIFMIFGRNSISNLIGSIMHIYVSTYLFNTYGSVFGFGEFIVMSYVMSIVGIVIFIYKMVKKI